MTTEAKQAGLWDRLTRKKTGKPTPTTHAQPRQVSLAALPSPDMPLRLVGADERYSLHGVMECGAEYTYLRLVKFEQRTDPMAQQAVAPLHLVLYAE